MKKWKSCGAFLLICALLLSALPLCAAAQDGLSLTYRQTAQGEVVLGISGLGAGRTIYGVEAEITLAGTYNANQIALSPADPLAYSPEHGTVVGQDQGKTVAKVYLVSHLPLNTNGTLTLGSLTVDGMGVVPESAKLLLLDSDGLSGGISSTPVSVPVVREGSGSGGSGSGSGGTSSGPVLGSSHTIHAPQAPHGTIQVLAAARANQVVTVTAKPDSGYKLDSLTVADSAGQPVALLDMGSGQYTFRMPDSDVSISAVFVSTGISLPFTDVKPEDWFYSSVQYVYQSGMMRGTGDDLFSPEMPTDRAMIVTILHRLEGSPAQGAGIFSDVPAGEWYASPVAWAAANGLVLGYGDGRFGPTDVITREQMVTILYRYAQFKGYSTTQSADLTHFPDLASLSGFAQAPMQWAVATGLVNGTDENLLAPQGTATRSQAAAILQRFCENIAVA